MKKDLSALAKFAAEELQNLSMRLSDQANHDGYFAFDTWGGGL